MKPNYSGLEENLSRVRGKIPAGVRLVIVTKNQPAEKAGELIALGERDFGENRVQEMEGKYRALREMHPEIVLHFVGHLQGNKAAKAVGMCEYIHSLDSLRLAGRVDAAAARGNKIQKVLVEVNIAGEKTKSGIEPGKVGGFLGELKKQDFKNLRVVGLMCIAPFVRAEETGKCFRRMRELAGENKLRELSMGMSSDFAQACREGATMVRIGTAIFGAGADSARRGCSE